LGTTLAPEFYIYKVNADLTPNTSQPFNLGLSRLETGELLEDANGLPGAEGIARRTNHPLGTNLYFSTSQQVYSGDTAPAIPSENIWWYNIHTCVTQKWVMAEIDGVRDGTGSWTEVADQERLDRWIGSSNVVGDPHVNYLAYSNEDGSVFGLIQLV
jgi:hypothetical protein